MSATRSQRMCMKMATMNPAFSIMKMMISVQRVYPWNAM